MDKLTFDYSGTALFMNKSEISNMSSFVRSAHFMLHEKTGAGKDFLGWVDLPPEF